MIQIEDIAKAFGPQQVFTGASAFLHPGTRVGLIGPNGSGKTTLLRLISGEEVADGGTIRIPKGLRVGYLPQELEQDPGWKVLEATHRGRYPEHEAQRLLAGLGFTPQDYDRPLLSLSGGYRMRVALAHLLLTAPDILLLDEPTNHLDADTQAWFEQFLLRSRATTLVVSHDTAFLNRVVTHIWEIHQQKIRTYVGNYERYVQTRQAREAQLEAAAQAQAREIARVERFVERFRYKATKARQVQSRLKQLEKVQRIERERDPKRVRFRFPAPAPSGRLVFDLQGVGKSYSSKTVYRALNFRVERGQRVALLGDNGVGKSTLLKILAGVLPIDHGDRLVGHGVTLHYFAQHQADVLNPTHTVLDALEEVAPRAELPWLRAVAGAFLFSGDEQYKPISVLSGGERSRVALARMLLNPANTLLLDEPTNHLDPASVDVLTDALLDFPGTIVFISHDPVFLSRVASRVVEIEDGTALDYPGDYAYYLWKRAQELDDEEEETPAARRNGRPHGRSPAAKPRAQGPDRRELVKALDRAERRLADLEGAVAELEGRIRVRDGELESEALYQDHARWHALHLERQRWDHDLEQLMAAWAQQSEQVAALQQQIAALDQAADSAPRVGSA
ncbi:MAG TPA: ABC-F family ATP-binding cassette domain-containing protein [Alphaproteobacteria bacterium]|nr:ABC-F family ATP-binding cassette domain-containing protein [Alphaproteobacteria bacterium]